MAEASGVADAVDRIMRVYDLMGNSARSEGPKVRGKIEAYISDLQLQGECDAHKLAMKGLIFLRGLDPSED